jgi:L-alanine-DL-glutamate epimerase-like enolase superfamily enzyme
LSSLAALEAAPVPIALDESALDALDHRAADAVCLKIARCGGITGLLAAARRARAVGYEVYLASTLDGPLGIAAALHAAAVITPDRPCGLATLSMFDSAGEPLPVRNGIIEAPATPGLGDFRRWYS